MEQLAHEIRERIKQLSALSGTDLKTEMDDLKMVLLQNPAATELLLPEDIGMAVAAIKRILGNAIQCAESPKPRAAPSGRKKVQLDLSMEIVDE